MATFNLGNVTGLLRSETPPTKKYVLWAKILNPSFPDLVDLHYWDEITDNWVPLTDPTTNYWLRPVIDNTLTAPPALPNEGDRYLIPHTGATGAWSGKEDKVTTYKGSAWQFQTPSDGFIVSVRTEESKLYDFRGVWGSGGFWGVNDFNVPIAPGSYIPATEKASPLGVATLDSSGLVLIDQINGVALPFTPANIPNWPGGVNTIWEALDYLRTLSAGGSIIQNDIVVSLSGGKTLGPYSNGQTIPSAGKTAEEVFRLIAIENVYPTYSVATLSLVKSAATIGEVGETVSNTLTATFAQHDAGAISAIQIKKNGTLLGTAGTTSPEVEVDASVARVLGDITYQAFANYGAGAIKNITPSGTPDDRTPAIRNPNAPQAAESNFASNPQLLTGQQKIFYGTYAGGSNPSTSAHIRALPQSSFYSGAGGLILNTGNANLRNVICLPVGSDLLSVVDLDAFNAVITANYIYIGTIAVADAGGTTTNRKVYVLTNEAPYPSNHRHSYTYS